jgi:hypothetical protein
VSYVPVALSFSPTCKLTETNKPAIGKHPPHNYFINNRDRRTLAFLFFPFESFLRAEVKSPAIFQMNAIKSELKVAKA